MVFLILDLSATFLQSDRVNDREGMPTGLMMLPDITSASKGIKVEASPNTLNTLLFSLYQANLLWYQFEIANLSEIVPSQYGILNIFHPANLLRTLINAKFGINKAGRVTFEMPSVPTVTFSNKIFKSNFEFKLAFLVAESEGVLKNFDAFTVDITTEAYITVNENVKIAASIKDFQINSFKTISNDFGVQLGNTIINFLINFELANLMETINKKYLSYLKIELPTFMGMNFTNSAAKILDNYFELELGVLFQ